MKPSQSDLKFATDFGHQWNPSYPNLRNIDAGRLAKMDGSERDAKDLIASVQRKDANVEMFCAAFHKGRKLDPDGDVGPATAAGMRLSRCAMPDYAPPPEARFQFGSDDLTNAVKSYQLWAENFEGGYEGYAQYRKKSDAGQYVGGRGSWPIGCDTTRPKWHSVVVAISTSGASAHQKAIMADILADVEATEAEMGQAVRHVLDGSYPKPQHNVSFQFIAGGVIGYAYFPTPNLCAQTVQARIDNSFDAARFVLAELLTHEYKGHSDGLEHSNGGIMNASILRPTKRASWKGDPHDRTKTGYFGGVALPLGPTPPPPPPPPGGDELDGTYFDLYRPGKSTRRFIPASEV